MLRRTLIYAVAALLFLLGMRWGTMAEAQETRTAALQKVQTSIIYHQTARSRQLGPTLPFSDFPNDPLAQHAYAAAAKIEPLLNQLPSTCTSARPKDRASLLKCFQNRQASRCPTCQREAYYAYQESRNGKNARQIRKGILKGAWKSVNLSRWKQPLSAKVAATG